MRTITIKSGQMGRYDDVSPFLVEEGKLDLHFVLPRVNGQFYLAIKNGGKTKTIQIPQTGDVVLSPSVGDLNIEVKHYLRGDLIENYKVEPLLIKNVSRDVYAFPEIGELQSQTSDMERKATALAKQIDAMKKDTEKTIGSLTKALSLFGTAFLAYIFTAYEKDLRLNAHDLSLEAFAEVLGLKTSEEVIRTIKTLKEKL